MGLAFTQDSQSTFVFMLCQRLLANRTPVSLHKALRGIALRRRLTLIGVEAALRRSHCESFGTVAYQSALRKTYSPTGSRRSRPPADQGWYRRRLQRESAGGNVRKSPNSKKSSIKAL